MTRPLSFLERFYPESRFGGFSDLDGTVAFYGRIQALLAAGMTVLDVGCGRGAGLMEDSVASFAICGAGEGRKEESSALMWIPTLPRTQV